MSKRAEKVTFQGLAPLLWSSGGFTAAILFAIAPLLLMGRHASGAASLAVMCLPVLLMFALYAWKSQFVLSEDGVTFRRYGVGRFIPYTQIAKAEVIQRLAAAGRRNNTKSRTVYTAVRLTLDDGKLVDLPVGQDQLQNPPTTSQVYGYFGAFHPNGWKLRSAIEERVREVREQHEPTDLAKNLMRGELALEEWRSKIAASAPSDETYRDAAKEALWRIVEDTGSPRDARAGAAMALREDLGVDGRARLRVVAEDCESPKLRVALETALDDEAEEERVLEALEKVSKQGE